MLEDILIPIVVFAAIFGVVYVIVSARHKERMALIESSTDPNLFKSSFKLNPYNLFKWGMFLIGLALGIIVANILDKANIMDPEAGYPSMILFFGGLALVIAYLLRSKLVKD